MKRLHINIQVNELSTSIAYYSRLFGAAPTVEKTDYAKWMLDEPHVNFAISATSGQPGIEHLGIQVDSAEELTALFAHTPALEVEGETTCCYSQSQKGWSKDPQGVEWEFFYTHGESETFHGDNAKTACCTPEANSKNTPCCDAQANGVDRAANPEAVCC